VKALRKTTFAATLFVVGIIIVASVYGIYSAYLAAPSSTTPTPTPTGTTSTTPTESPTTSPAATATSKPTTKPTNAPVANPTASPTPAPTSVTVTDGAGNTMTIQLPVTKIAVLEGGVAEVLCAMGVEDLIVGRTDSCTLPPSILSVTSYGTSDYAANVEGLLSLDPDIIFASPMLPYNTVAYEQLTNAGIPIYIFSTSPSERQTPPEMAAEELYNAQTPIDYICGFMQNITAIVGHQDEVDEYVEWAQYYNTLVKDRIATLTPDQRPKVLIEEHQAYQSIVSLRAYQAGGINIGENQTTYSAILSPEFVVEQNPSVIIHMVSSSSHNINDFIAARNEVLTRGAIQNVDAVKYGRVYVCDFYARSGIRCVVGYLYWATWLQPSLFADINPAAINQELNQKFFGTSIAGTFAYP
jgi:iron complex transport system substrate-binding protein